MKITDEMVEAMKAVLFKQKIVDTFSVRAGLEAAMALYLRPAPAGEAVRELVKSARFMERTVSNMRVPQNAAEAGLQVSITIGPALENLRAALEALSPSPPIQETTGE